MAFIRFQEHYDSPKFKNKCFTLDEFKAWYMKENKTKAFTYYTDWAGYNFPDTALNVFQQGRFKEITEAEKSILKRFSQVKGRFYVIGSKSGDDETFRHEMAHAFYYLEPEYRKKAEFIVNSHDTKAIKKWLKGQGYDDDVIIDEIQAHSVKPSDIQQLNAQTDYKDLITDITDLFEKECNKIPRKLRTLRGRLLGPL